MKLVSFFLSTLTSQQMVKRRREITVDSSWCPVIWTQKNCIMRTTTEDSWIISKSVCKKFCIINANWARYRKSTVIMINHFYQAGEMTKLDQLRMSRLSFWRENSNISTYTQQINNIPIRSRCLKITEKVSLRAKRATYILSGQKYIKNAKNYSFGEF